MSQSIPDAPTLIAAAVKYLEDELMPVLESYHRFKTRVTINVLNTVRRELELREAQKTAESARLSEIVGHEGGVEELSRGLCDLIRAGGIDLNDPALRAHVRQSLADALAINNPKWTAG